ncbi:MAG: DUF547 domain-containing protein [Ginsengibacter sp.]
MKKIITLFTLSLLLLSASVGYSRSNEKDIPATTPPSHEAWTKLLKKYVTPNGLVNYKGFIKDIKELDAYLATLTNNPPDGSKWSKNEELAYWFNAYNAFTVKLITMHYPVSGIKKIGPDLQVIFVNTPWDKNFFKIGNAKFSLNDIEHKTLRKKFDEPRMHFALNCASISCPKLRNEAYEASKLESQLDDQARAFLSDKSKNIITPGKIQVSKIFSWYGKDFTKSGGKIDFLNKYAPVKINRNADIDYLDYNWDLNEQK